MKNTVVRFVAVSALLLSVGSLAAAEVYKVTGNVTDGIDLVGGGYQTDRIDGPSTAAATVSGTITHADGLTPEHPFTIAGFGKKITFGADTGIEAVPLKFTATAANDWQFKGKTAFRGGVEFGANCRLILPYGEGDTFVCGDGANAVDFNLDAGKVYAYSRLVVGNQLGDANFLMAGSGSQGYQAEGKYDFVLGKEDSPGRTGIRVSMSIAGATMNVRYLILMEGVYGSGVENCFVTNGVGGVIMARYIIHKGGDYSRITFDGGRYVSSGAEPGKSLFNSEGSSWNSKYPNPRITVEGVNGNAIDLETDCDRDLCTGCKSYCPIMFIGDCDFVKRGTGVLSLARNAAYTAEAITTKLAYTGDTIVKGGGLKLTVGDFQPKGGTLVLEGAGTTFDLNGVNSDYFKGVSGLGSVINTSETAATLTLGTGNANGEFNAVVAKTVPVVKTGAGTLVVGANAANYEGDLTVNAGTVKVSAGIGLLKLGTMTIASGATLDIRGAGFGCARLVNNGTLLSDETSTIVIGGDDDVTYVNPRYLGAVEKIGEDTATVCGGLDGVESMTVSAGTLAYRPISFGGKYFGLVYQCGVNGRQFMELGEFALYDVNGKRVNAGAYSWTPIITEESKVYGFIDDASGLAEHEVQIWRSAESASKASQAINDNEGPDKLFDGNAGTKCALMYSSGNSGLAFHIPDDSAAVAGYLLTTSNNRSSCLIKWALFGSYDGKTWIKLDEGNPDFDWNTATDEEKDAARAVVPGTGQTDYNGGVPYLFGENVDADEKVFGDAALTVAAGATLDLQANTLRIAHLVIDCAAGAGTITRFTPAANGRLVLENADGLGDLVGYELPVTVGEIGDTSALRTWKVSVGGVEEDSLRVCWRNGKLMLKGCGLLLQLK